MAGPDSHPRWCPWFCSPSCSFPSVPMGFLTGHWLPSFCVSFLPPVFCFLIISILPASHSPVWGHDIFFASAPGAQSPPDALFISQFKCPRVSSQLCVPFDKGPVWELAASWVQSAPFVQSARTGNTCKKHGCLGKAHQPKTLVDFPSFLPSFFLPSYQECLMGRHHDIYNFIGSFQGPKVTMYLKSDCFSWFHPKADPEAWTYV